MFRCSGFCVCVLLLFVGAWHAVSVASWLFYCLFCLLRVACLMLACGVGLWLLSVGCFVDCRFVLICGWLVLGLLLWFVVLRVFWMLSVG